MYNLTRKLYFRQHITAHWADNLSFPRYQTGQLIRVVLFCPITLPASLQAGFFFKSADIAAALLPALAESPGESDRHTALALALDY